MDRSPRSREIEPVEGQPGDIIYRGKQIEALGGKMARCADTLKRISTDAVGDDSQRGKAIDSLRDSIGDAYVVLQQAADLYTPVGPHITTYGQELERLQPAIDDDVSDCERLWATYESLPGDRDGSTSPQAGGGLLGIGGYDADSPEAKQEAADNAAKRAAYEAWEEAAARFDEHYDSWEDAFEAAADGIGREMAESIKDSRWSSIADVLEVAALVVGVAALIIGGPIMAAVALFVGVALLAVTYMSYKNGERSATDVWLSVVGVVPFTKISTLTRLAHMGRGASKLAIAKNVTGVSGLSGLGRASSDLVRRGKVFHADGLVGAWRNRGPVAVFDQVTLGSPTGYASVLRTHRRFYEGAGARLASLRESKTVDALAAVDFAAGVFSATSRNIGLADKALGIERPDLPTTVQFAL